MPRLIFANPTALEVKSVRFESGKVGLVGKGEG